MLQLIYLIVFLLLCTPTWGDYSPLGSGEAGSVVVDTGSGKKKVNIGSGADQIPRADANGIISISGGVTFTGSDAYINIDRSADPSTPASGDIWRNSTDGRLKVYSGGGVQEFATLDDVTGSGGATTLHTTSGNLVPGFNYYNGTTAATLVLPPAAADTQYVVQNASSYALTISPSQADDAIGTAAAGSAMVSTGSTSERMHLYGVSNSLFALYSSVGSWSELVGDVCTGGLLFSWYAEDFNVTAGMPVGCSAGDITASAVGNAVLATTTNPPGSKSLHSPKNGDYVTFDWSTDDIMSRTEGTATFKVYPNSHVSAGHSRFIVLPGTDDYIRITWLDTGYVYIYYRNSSVGTASAVTPDTLTLSAWNTITAKWRQTGSPNLSVQIGAGTPGTYTGTINPAWPSTPTQLIIGNNGVEANYYIDDIKIDNTWQ